MSKIMVEKFEKLVYYKNMKTGNGFEIVGSRVNIAHAVYVTDNN